MALRITRAHRLQCDNVEIWDILQGLLKQAVPNNILLCAIILQTPLQIGSFVFQFYKMC